MVETWGKKSVRIISCSSLSFPLQTKTEITSVGKNRIKKERCDGNSNKIYSVIRGIMKCMKKHRGLPGVFFELRGINAWQR